MEDTSTSSRDDSTTKAAAVAGYNVLGLSLANNTIKSWVVIVLSSILFFWHSVRRKASRGNNSHTYCPNPNCIRCRRYAEVNANARRRLPWVLKAVNHKSNELERVSQAVRQGPRSSQNNNHDGIFSPVLGQYPTVLLVHGMIAQPLVTSLHPHVKKVFDHDKTLRQRLFAEYIAAQTDQISWLRNDVQEGEWKVLHLLNQGVWQEEHCKKCPILATVIQQLQPHVMDKCLFGNAFVSVLQPGTTIEPHCGPTNVRHRFHYGLQVIPDDEEAAVAAAKLIVMDKQQTWREGHYFVFDDSFTHSVVYPVTNPSCKNQRARVVLIVDLWHPQLSPLERKVITELYPAGVTSTAGG